jgi:hypothetical protein
MSIIADNPWDERPEGAPNREVMQLDGGFGAVTAITEILVQQRRDGIHVLPDIPRNWREFDFEGMYTEGAFRIGAKVENRQVTEVSIESLEGGDLKLWHGLGENWEVSGEKMEGALLEKSFEKGEKVLLKRV